MPSPASGASVRLRRRRGWQPLPCLVSINAELGVEYRMQFRHPILAIEHVNAIIVD